MASRNSQVIAPTALYWYVRLASSHDPAAQLASGNRTPGLSPGVRDSRHCLVISAHTGAAAASRRQRALRTVRSSPPLPRSMSFGPSWTSTRIRSAAERIRSPIVGSVGACCGPPRRRVRTPRPRAAPQGTAHAPTLLRGRVRPLWRGTPGSAAPSSWPPGRAPLAGRSAHGASSA